MRHSLYNFCGVSQWIYFNNHHKMLDILCIIEFIRFQIIEETFITFNFKKFGKNNIVDHKLISYQYCKSQFNK